MNQLIARGKRILCSFHSKQDKLFSLADNGLLSLARMAAGVAIAQLAGADAFAGYILLLTIQVLLQTIGATLFITPMITVAAGLDRLARRDLFVWGRRRLLLPTLILLAFASLSWVVLIPRGISVLTYTGFYASLVATLFVCYERAVLQVGFETRRALLGDGVGTLILAVGLLVGSIWLQDTVAGFWWGSAIGAAVSCLLMRYPQQPGSPRNVEPATRLRMRTMGKVMTVGSIANSACSRVQPFVLGAASGTLAVAHFGAASTLIGPLRMLSGALGGVLRPRLSLHLSSGRPAGFRKAMYQAYALTGGLGLCGVLVMLGFGPFLMRFLFGDEFAVSYSDPTAYAASRLASGCGGSSPIVTFKLLSSR
ncbi:MAG: hypothetical protein AAF191_16625, partial [Verrucomicrobiota bacterium]